MQCECTLFDTMTALLSFACPTTQHESGDTGRTAATCWLLGTGKQSALLQWRVYPHHVSVLLDLSRKLSLCCCWVDTRACAAVRTICMHVLLLFDVHVLLFVVLAWSSHVLVNGSMCFVKAAMCW